MNFSIINLNVRIFVVYIDIVLFVNLIFSYNWLIVDQTILITPKYSEYDIHSDIINGLHTINGAIGFIFY